MKLEQLLENSDRYTDIEIDGGQIVSTHKSEYNGSFNCSHGSLITLKGCPPTVTGEFDCSANNLTSLEHCPSSIGEYVDCEDNKLTSLENVHKYIKDMSGSFYANDNPITSHVLGLFFIKGITRVLLDNRKVEKIMNEHLYKGRPGLIVCQNQLIEAGFEDYAQI